MRRSLLLCTLCFLPWILKAQISDIHNPELHPTLTNKTPIDSIKSEPISFYLENPQIDQYSKLYYQGKFAVADDNITFAILDSLDSDNSSVRPFYYYVVSQILSGDKAALSELSGFFILEYLTSYPCEFFELSNELNTDLDFWIYLTAYEIYFSNNPSEYQKQTTKVIDDLVNSGCPEYEENTRSIKNEINKILTDNRE